MYLLVINFGPDSLHVKLLKPLHGLRSSPVIKPCSVSPHYVRMYRCYIARVCVFVICLQLFSSLGSGWSVRGVRASACGGVGGGRAPRFIGCSAPRCRSHGALSRACLQEPLYKELYLPNSTWFPELSQLARREVPGQLKGRRTSYRFLKPRSCPWRDTGKQAHGLQARTHSDSTLPSLIIPTRRWLYPE